MTHKKSKRKKNIHIAILAVVCIATIAVVFHETLVKRKYNKAIALINARNFDEAYVLLDGLEYKDSYQKCAAILPYCTSKKLLLSKAEVGSIVSFGAYEQDNETSNDKEPIEWIVIDKSRDNILVVSKYCLDCKKYETEYRNVTWETCSLRKWLNEEFLNEAFSKEEQDMIQNAIVTADANPQYSAPAGNNTIDKVFCLSIDEVCKYFTTDDARKCHPTAYAVIHNASESSDGYCYFWLRTPGFRSIKASFVRYNGEVRSIGDYVYFDYYAVRPALRITI
ncbi:MAG: DUF6273 domain-containing protein [bacterium]|nr:DUF6273 domain-containing protein [bacterium]